MAPNTVTGGMENVAGPGIEPRPSANKADALTD